MCLLVFSHGGCTPEYDDLKMASYNNPDGFGWAMIADKEIIKGHSMKFDDAWDAYAKARASFPDGPSLFHLRISTVQGTINLDNCHPFWVKGTNEEWVMGHNGILPTEEDPAGNRSDTKVFAEEYMPNLGLDLDDPLDKYELGRFIGRGNKLVFLTVDPRYDQDFYIINESEGHWKRGVWFSNYSYSYSTRRSYTPYSTGWGEDYEWQVVEGRGGWARKTSTTRALPTSTVKVDANEDGHVRVTVECNVCKEFTEIDYNSGETLCKWCSICLVCKEWDCECDEEEIHCGDCGFEWSDCDCPPASQVHGMNDEGPPAEEIDPETFTVTRNGVVYKGSEAWKIIDEEADLEVLRESARSGEAF